MKTGVVLPSLDPTEYVRRKDRIYQQLLAWKRALEAAEQVAALPFNAEATEVAPGADSQRWCEQQGSNAAVAAGGADGEAGRA